MNKVIKDGHVAVLYSSGYGSGWSTWNDIEIKEQLLFDPGIVEIVQSYLDNKISYEQEQRYIQFYLAIKYGKSNVYSGGIDGLDIAWVPVGSKFRIEEYDGNESVMFDESYTWFTA